jgi:hypothetical protein
MTWPLSRPTVLWLAPFFKGASEAGKATQAILAPGSTAGNLRKKCELLARRTASLYRGKYRGPLAAIGLNGQ